MKCYGMVGYIPGTNRLDFEWSWFLHRKPPWHRRSKVKIVFLRITLFKTVTESRDKKNYSFL